MISQVAERLRILADAELPRGEVSPLVLKTVLAIILAHELEWISNIAIARRAGLDQATVVNAIRKLEALGLVTIDVENRYKRRFTVCDQRLRAMGTAVPVWHHPRHRAVAVSTPPPPQVAGSEALADLFGAMNALQIPLDEYTDILGDARTPVVRGMRTRLVVYLRDVRNLTWPRIAAAVRGSTSAHSTCQNLYENAKRESQLSPAEPAGV